MPANADWQSCSMDQILNPLNIPTVDFALLFSGHCRQNGAHSHRFTVQPRAVTGELFNGVTECVTEIQFGAFALFFFISGDDAGLTSQDRPTTSATVSGSSALNFSMSRSSSSK